MFGKKITFLGRFILSYKSCFLRNGTV